MQIFTILLDVYVLSTKDSLVKKKITLDILPDECILNTSKIF